MKRGIVPHADGPNHCNQLPHLIGPHPIDIDFIYDSAALSGLYFRPSPSFEVVSERHLYDDLWEKDDQSEHPADARSDIGA